MLKKYAPKILWILIFCGFLLVPAADARIFSYIPLYPLDGVLLLILLVSLFLLWKESERQKFPAIILLLLGIGAWSSMFSWFANGGTLTGLGQLKSWLILPGFAGCMVAFALQAYPERNRQLLRCWYGGVLVLLAIVMGYIFLQSFTFDGRLQGPFTSPNFLAFFLFPGVLLSYYFFEQVLEKKQKIFFALTGTFFLITLFLTHSFGGMLALTASLSWYFFYKDHFFLKKKKQLIFSSLILVGIFIGAELILNDKLQGMFNDRSSVSSRIIIWTVAVRTVVESPLLGIGVGNFQETYLAYQPLYPPYLEWAVPQPHNLVLALWLQMGIVGLFAMVVLVFRALFHTLTRSSNQEHYILQALLIGMLVYGIFDTPLFGNALGFVWWTVLAFLLIPSLKKEKDPR